MVCRSLGFYGGQTRQCCSSQICIPGTGVIWLSSMHCMGSETHIAECDNSGIGYSTCSHEQDIGVECDTEYIQQGNPKQSSFDDINITGCLVTVLSVYELHFSLF